MMPFTDQELGTISEIQVLSKQVKQMNRKLEASKKRCDTASSAYTTASRKLEQQLVDRNELIQEMSTLKLKLMREMREYTVIPKAGATVVLQSPDQIGRTE